MKYLNENKWKNNNILHVFFLLFAAVVRKVRRLVLLCGEFIAYRALPIIELLNTMQAFAKNVSICRLEGKIDGASFFFLSAEKGNPLYRKRFHFV